MKTPFLKQKLKGISSFQFFLWIFLFGFVIIFPVAESSAAEKFYTARGKRDPFVPLVSAGSKPSVTGGLIGVESLEEIVVEGVVYDKNPANSIVVLNGSVMTSGEEISSVKVLKIDPSGALISVNGIEGYKSLYQEEEAKKAEE